MHVRHSSMESLARCDLRAVLCVDEWEIQVGRFRMARSRCGRE